MNEINIRSKAFRHPESIISGILPKEKEEEWVSVFLTGTNKHKPY
jgi:hypothetical protein